MRTFGMITTTLTWEYTSYALKSFFRTTKLEGSERLYLIDNDNTFEEDTSLFSPYLEIIKNETPSGYAFNHNNILKIAAEQKSDYYLLSNDVIYTEDWHKPLTDCAAAIVCSYSNRNIQYERGGFTWKESLKLSDYLAKRSDFKEILSEHKAKSESYQDVPSVPFFCTKISLDVYEKVGMLNESFSGEDEVSADYCKQASAQGFSIKYAPQSFVLNFNVKK